MIIAVTDRKISAASDFLEQIEKVAATLPDMLILREKDLAEVEYRYLAVECMRICGTYNVRFCVNSFIKTAAAVNNGRIQVSYDTLKQNKEKLEMFEERWVSVHSLTEAVNAEEMGATHLIYGNIFETSSKPNVWGKGVDDLKYTSSVLHTPVYAIGGIGVGNIARVMETGCAGVCIRSLFMEAKNPSEAMAELRRRIKKR
jgi:thiamine-phosphate pyrophosphorylase